MNSLPTTQIVGRIVILLVTTIHIAAANKYHQAVTIEMSVCISGRDRFKFFLSGNASMVEVWHDFGEVPGGPVFCNEQPSLSFSKLELPGSNSPNQTVDFTIPWPAQMPVFCGKHTERCTYKSTPMNLTLLDDQIVPRCAHKFSAEVFGRGKWLSRVHGPWKYWSGNAFQIDLDDRGHSWDFDLGDLDWTNSSGTYRVRITCGGQTAEGEPCRHYNSRCLNSSYDHREICVCDTCRPGYSGENCNDLAAPLPVLPLTQPIHYEATFCISSLASIDFLHNGIQANNIYGERPNGNIFCGDHPTFSFRNLNESTPTEYHWKDWSPMLPAYCHGHCIRLHQPANYTSVTTSDVINLGAHHFSTERCRWKFIPGTITRSHPEHGGSFVGRFDRPWNFWWTDGTYFRALLQDGAQLVNYSSLITINFTCGGELLSGPCNLTNAASHCKNATYDNTPRELCVCHQCEDGWSGAECDIPVPKVGCNPQVGCDAGQVPTADGRCKVQCRPVPQGNCQVEHPDHGSVLNGNETSNDVCSGNLRKCVTIWGDPHVKFSDMSFHPQWQGWMLVSQCDGLQLFSYATPMRGLITHPVTVQSKILIRYFRVMILLTHLKTRLPTSLKMEVLSLDAGDENFVDVPLPNYQYSTTVGEGDSLVSVARLEDNKIQLCTSDGNTIVITRNRFLSLEMRYCLSPTCNLRANGFLGVHAAPLSRRFPLPSDIPLDKDTPEPQAGTPYGLEHMSQWRDYSIHLLTEGSTIPTSNCPEVETPAPTQGTNCMNAALNKTVGNEAREEAKKPIHHTDKENNCTQVIARCQTECPPAILAENMDRGDLCAFAQEYFAAKVANANLTLDDPWRLPENCTSHSKRENFTKSRECPPGEHYCDNCSVNGTGGCFSCPNTPCPSGTQRVIYTNQGNCGCAAPPPECNIDFDCATPPSLGTCQYVKCQSQKCVTKIWPKGFVCRPAADSCDFAEQCTGVSTTCPSDAKNLSCTVATASPAPPLWVPTTTSAPTTQPPPQPTTQLPATTQQPATPTTPPTTTSATTNFCRVDSDCQTNTSTPSCAAYQCVNQQCTKTVQPRGTVCRPSRGACDVEDQCDGASAECPADQLHSAGRVCRATAACDYHEEVCDGKSVDCPTNIDHRHSYTFKCALDCFACGFVDPSAPNGSPWQPGSKMYVGNRTDLGCHNHAQCQTLTYLPYPSCLYTCPNGLCPPNPDGKRSDMSHFIDLTCNAATNETVCSNKIDSGVGGADKTVCPSWISLYTLTLSLENSTNGAARRQQQSKTEVVDTPELRVAVEKDLAEVLGTPVRVHSLNHHLVNGTSLLLIKFYLVENDGSYANVTDYELQTTLKNGTFSATRNATHTSAIKFQEFGRAPAASNTTATSKAEQQQPVEPGFCGQECIIIASAIAVVLVLIIISSVAVYALYCRQEDLAEEFPESPKIRSIHVYSVDEPEEGNEDGPEEDNHGPNCV